MLRGNRGILSSFCRRTALLTQSRFRHLHPVPRISADPLQTVNDELKRQYTLNPTIHDLPVVRQPGDMVDVQTVVKNWCSFPGMGFNSLLDVKVHQFEVAENEVPNDDTTMRLPNDIFAVPIRKDLVHYAYWFHRRAMAGYTMRMQLYAYEWPGSKKKIRSQRATGKSRVNWLKAPGKYVGVQAHPLRPHDQRRRINRKTLWESMKVMLSAKYMDNSLIVVDNFRLASHKTRHAVRALRRLVGYRCNSALLIHEGKVDINDNFRFATANVSAIRRENVDTLSTYALLRYRKVIITKDALEKLIKMITLYPNKQKWIGVNATPDGKPVPEKIEPVKGWDAEWKAKKAAEKEKVFTKHDLMRRMKEWKWTNTTKGPFKVPRHDPFAKFQLLEAKLQPYVPTWARTDQIVYQDEDSLDFDHEAEDQAEFFARFASAEEE